MFQANTAISTPRFARTWCLPFPAGTFPSNFPLWPTIARGQGRHGPVIAYLQLSQEPTGIGIRSMVPWRRPS
jgi:hypothetical protein